MIKNLSLLCVVFLSGCILYVGDPNTTQDYSGSTDLWIYDAYMDCSYDYYYGSSRWELAAELASSYSYYADEVTVGVYLDGWDYYELYYDGYDWWSTNVTAYFDCYDVYFADFVVSDVYGNYDEITVWW